MKKLRIVETILFIIALLGLNAINHYDGSIENIVALFISGLSGIGVVIIEVYLWRRINIQKLKGGIKQDDKENTS